MTVGLLNLARSAAIPRDANGWSIFTPAPSTKIIYVAAPGSGGSDSNDGLTTSTPVTTLAHAKTLMRGQGFSDWVLLNKGDTWNEAFGNTTVAGPSAGWYSMFGSYGAATGRPKLNCGNSAGLFFASLNGANVVINGLDIYCDVNDPASATYTAPIAISAGALSGTSVLTFASPLPLTVQTGISVYNLTTVAAISNTSNTTATVSGDRLSLTISTPLAANVSTGDLIEFHCDATGIDALGKTTFLHVEDCKLSFWHNDGINISTNGVDWPFKNYNIRRCVIVDGTRNTQGCIVQDNALTVTPLTNLPTNLIEDCFFDHNGWQQQDNSNPLSPTLIASGGTVFCHDVYMHDLSGSLTLQNNILANPSLSGVQHRSNGVAYNNAFIRCPVGLSVGGATGMTAASYNTFSETCETKLTIRATSAITSAAGGTPNVLNFDLVPAMIPVSGCRVRNLTNPSSISTASPPLVTGKTATTVTIFSNVLSDVQAGDVICFFTEEGASANLGSNSDLYLPLGQGACEFGPHNVLCAPATWGIFNGRGITNTFMTAFAPSNVHDNWLIGQFYSIQDNATITGAVSDANGTKVTVQATSSSGTAGAFLAGQPITISGITSGTTELNGTWTILSVPDTSHIVIPVTFVHTFVAPSIGNVGVFNGGNVYTSNHQVNPVHANPFTAGIAAPATFTLAGTPTVPAYMASIGATATTEAFLAACRLQSKDTWDVRYTANALNNYLRAQTNAAIPLQ
jgi:hypothetical protein